MKKFVLIAMLSMAFVSPTKVEAAFQVTLTVFDSVANTTTTRTIDDGGAAGPGTLADASGLGLNGDGLSEIRFNLSATGISGLTGTVVVLSNEPGDIVEGAQLSTSLSSARNRTGSAGFASARLYTITIRSTQTGYLVPGSVGDDMLLTNDPGTSFTPSTAGITNASFISYVGLTDQPYSQDVGTTSAPITTSNPVTTDTNFTLTNGPPYSISNALALTIASGGNAGTNSLGGNSSVTAVVPVPPALALLVSGVPFAVVYLRRRKQA